MNTELLSYIGNTKQVERLVIRVTDGPAAGTEFRTETGEFSIGSSESADFTIDDPSISAHPVA